MNSAKTTFVLLLASAAVMAFPAAYGFLEDWDNAPVGTYVPASDGQLPRLIPGDEGDWILDDTVTAFPECGATPHTGQIIDRGGDHVLRLNSGNSNSGCADNVWVVLFEVPPLDLNPGFSVPISPATMISFEQAGMLENPQTGSPNCLVRPCGNTVSLEVEDSRGNVVAYIFQRAPGAVPNTLHAFYREIFLDPAGGVFSRNLFDDFNTVPSFDPAGAAIRSLAFTVNEHGWGEIDEICIGENGCDRAIPIQRDDVVVGFGGIGLWARMNDASWLKLNNSSPDRVVTADMDSNGEDDVVADFSSTLGGIFAKRNLGAWSKLHNFGSELLAAGDLDGNGKDEVIVNFGAIGLWARMNDASWLKLANTSPAQVVAGDLDGNGADDVVAVFDSGLFVKRNLGGWSKLHNMVPEKMAVGDLDNSGRDDLIVDFGTIALWARMNDSAWLKLHNSSPELIAAGDLDGNGAEDVLATFAGLGLWQKLNLGGWSALNANAPEDVVTGDITGSGKDDIIGDFGSTLGGIFVRRDQGAWAKLHNSNPDSLAPGNLDSN